MNWKLETQILELRYKRGYRLWDLSGKLVMHFLDKFPEFEVGSAAPDRIELVRKRDGTRAIIGIDTANVRVPVENTSANEAYDICDEIFKTVHQGLEISVLTRVGNRLIYTSPCDSDDKAKETIDRIARANGIGGDLLEVDDERISAKKVWDFHIRLADEKTGITMNVTPVITQINLDGTFAEEWRKKIPPPVHAVQADFDIYTVSALPSDAFIPKEFVRSNIKMVETRLLPRLNK